MSEGISTPPGDASLCPGGNQAIFLLAHALLPLINDLESGATLSSVASGAVMNTALLSDFLFLVVATGTYLLLVELFKRRLMKRLPV